MAAEKNFTEIRYFVKNSTTTAAFSQTFIGNSTGVAGAYPWAVLDNTPGFSSLVADNEIKFPTLLTGNCTLTNASTTVTAVSPATPFVNAAVGDYLLYNDGAGVDNLKVLGVIATKTSSSVVVLAKANTVVTTGAYPVYLLKKGGASVGFKADSSFYILVKSTNFPTGGTLRDAVLWLDVPGTHTNPTSATAAPSLGWGANSPVNLNPEYFNFIEISVSNAADEPLNPIDESADIPCSIKRISGYVNSGNFTSNDQFPYWVAYEVNPFGDFAASLDKKTTFKIQFSEDLPAGQLGTNSTTVYNWAQQGAL
jgi:hypothetical protein